MDTKFLNWFLSGGSVAVPKRLLAYMATLELSFEELGEIVYLLAQEGRVSAGDVYAKTAATNLVQKHLITYNVDSGDVSFQPLFDRMLGQTTAGEAAAAQGNAAKEQSYETLTEVVRRYEKERGVILPAKARGDISEVIQRYGWASDLVYALYDYFQRNQRQHYNFLSFAQLAHNAGVNDLASLQSFVKGLDYEFTKVREVLRLLGKRNAPTEPQRALYAKWTGDWGFSHELVLMAIDDTTGADNPSMNYLDAILENWRRMGISHRDQVEAYRAQQKNTRAQNRAARPAVKKRAQTRYVSQEGPRDFSDREE